MSKDSVKIKAQAHDFLSFSEFWQTIADELGNSRIKINTEATSIKQFLRADSDHKEFMRTLIHQSYKRCHCYHLNARFDVNVALDVLGETSFSLKGNKEDDLLDIELLEEIAWLISQRYEHKVKMPESLLIDINEDQASVASNKNQARLRTAIISMSKRKIRLANQKH